MLVSGVFLSASAVALLARCLQRAGQTRLDHCPELLRPLRDALQANTRRSGENLA
jgi:hypothetical protein